MVYNYTKPRAPIAAMYSSPGPCYGLPGLVGQNIHDPRSVHYKGAAYSFGTRHGKWRDDCSPGPCYLPDPKIYREGRDGTPHYSLYGRQKDGAPFPVPGPGAYTPERSGPNSKYMPPSYSFGTRHRHRSTDKTPAPNSYALPGMLGSTVMSGKRQAPCYSLTGRSKTGGFHEDLQKTPGPGCYNTLEPSVTKDRAPLYSMTSRNVMPGDSTKKPGPGAHSPEKHSSDVSITCVACSIESARCTSTRESSLTFPSVSATVSILLLLLWMFKTKPRITTGRNFHGEDFHGKDFRWEDFRGKDFRRVMDTASIMGSA